MSQEKTAPGKGEGPLSRVVDGVKFPAVKAGQIVNEIADQAPLYGLSGAILAVGLVTGRRALARTGAQMLTSQIVAALARSVSERLLPDEKEPAKTADDEPATPTPAAVDEAPSSGKSTAAKAATGALAGAAALAAGGWLLGRLLTRKPADKAED